MKKFKIVTFNTIVGREWTVEKEVVTAGGYDDFELVYVEGEDKEKFLEEAADADGVCAWTYLGEEEFNRMPKCKIVVSPGIGIDRFNLQDATDCGVMIANVPDYCIEEVAVHTVAMMLDCIRKVTMLDREIRNGVWKVMACGKMYRMWNRTYGLMSFGHIPQRITQLLKPFGVKFITYDPFATSEVLEKFGVERAESINELFEKSDYISIHTPYMESTHHIIGTEQFNRIKEECILVITGRGGVVDEDALKNAIERGKPRIVGIDVIEDEINYKSVLMGMDEVIMTPHSAYYTEDANDELKRKVIQQIVDVVRTSKKPTNLLNTQVIGKSRMEECKRKEEK